MEVLKKEIGELDIKPRIEALFEFWEKVFFRANFFCKQK